MQPHKPSFHCFEQSCNKRIRTMNTPTPKKKGTSTADDNDRVSQARYKVATDLRPKGRLPYLDNVVGAIEKLLRVNNELLKRCKHSIDIDGPKLVPLTVLSKRMLNVVKRRNVQGHIQFVTYPVCAEMIFNIKPLMTLPAELGRIPHETHMSGLINYDSFFEASLLLDDTVLVPFLSNLKGHLVSVQSCLTEIDNWLAIPTTNVPFLDYTFGRGTVREAEKRHRENPLCRNCRCPFRRHNRRGQITTCLDGRSYYVRSKYWLLKEFVSNKSKHESFDLNDTNDRSKLVGLVEYLSRK